MLHFLGTGLLAGAIALGINAASASLALKFTGVPRGFPPFTIYAPLAGCIGGSVLAALAYATIQALAPQPETIFVAAAALTLLASFSLPRR